MYCGKCGYDNGTGSMFCAKCGAELNNAQPAEGYAPQNYAQNEYAPQNYSQANYGSEYYAPQGYAPEYYTPAAPKPQKNKKKIGIIAGVAAALVVVIVCLIIFIPGGKSNSNYQNVVSKYIDAQFNVDAKAILDLIPENVVKEMMYDEGYGYGEYDEFVNDINDDIKDEMGMISSYGFNIKHSYKIDYVDEIYGSDLDYIIEDYRDYGVQVVAAMEVDVVISVNIGGYESDFDEDISLIKVGDLWYLDVENMYIF